MSGVSLDTSPICSICQEQLPEGIQPMKKENFEVKDLDVVRDGTSTQVKCGHIFHANCIHDWVKEFRYKTTPPPCPTCRKDLAEPFVTPPPSSATAHQPTDRPEQLGPEGPRRDAISASATSIINELNRRPPPGTVVLTHLRGANYDFQVAAAGREVGVNLSPNFEYGGWGVPRYRNAGYRVEGYQ